MSLWASENPISADYPRVKSSVKVKQSVLAIRGSPWPEQGVRRWAGVYQGFQMAGWRYQTFPVLWISGWEKKISHDFYFPRNIIIVPFILSFLTSSSTQWLGPTDTTIPQPTVSTCTPLRSPFHKPHLPPHQQLNRKRLNQRSQMPAANESGSSLSWSARTPPPISARTWERRPRRRPSPQPLLRPYPPSTETTSTERRGFVMTPEIFWHILTSGYGVQSCISHFL